MEKKLDGNCTRMLRAVFMNLESKTPQNNSCTATQDLSQKTSM